MSDPFDDLIAANPLPSDVAANGRPIDPFEALLAANPKPAEQPSALARAGSVAKDIGRSLETGVDRGVAGLVGLPNAAIGLADQYLIGPPVRALGRAVGLTPNSDRPGGDPRPTIADGFPTQEAVLGAMTGGRESYKPQTTAGEYAQTLGEFLPGAGTTPAKLARFALAPALASETAGQVTKGTEAEPWARAAVGIATGVGAGMVGRPSAAERIFDRSAGKVSPEEVAQAQALVDDAKAAGVALTWPEALQQTVGPRRMGDVMRVVEGEGGLSEFFAARPDQIKAAGKAGLDAITPAATNPTRLGEQVQAAAQAAVAGTPEGQGVIRATQAAGQRVTQDQAGQVIQREMRGVADAREAARKVRADADYAAARDAPESVGVEGTVTVERPGEPIVTQPKFARPQFEADAPRPVEAFERPAGTGPDDGPESLARFIARNGGLRLDGDAAATDLHRFVVPGVGKVARPDGKSLDNFWRERLIEEGYFRPDPDGGMARDISSELLRKLQNEQRGVPSYPMDAQGRPRGRAASGQAADEYAAARSTAESRLAEDLTGAGIDPAGVHPDIRDRAVGALMRGEIAEPLDAYERVVNRMKGPLEPYVKSTTITEEIPDVRFGQVNPQAALDAIDAHLLTAKGDVRAELQRFRNDLFGPGGETDLTIAGLLKARERQDYRIQAALKDGDGTKVRDLQIARSALDGQLKGVPAVAAADANFAANSRPLEPFTGNTPLARVVRRDDLGRMTTPAEQVPTNILGATAAREFLANATPAARRAFQDREVTRILDEVSGGEGGATAASIRTAMRREEDLLAQLPEARGRLTRLALAHQARETILRSPLGRIAAQPDAKAAINVLFPIGKTVEGSAEEVGQAVSAIAKSNPLVARQLVRTYLGTEFAAKTKDLQTGSNQMGGAKFAAAIRGNDLQNDSLRSALRALPNGAAIDTGFSRLLDIMEATGQRQIGGSKTTFNTALREDLKTDGALKEVGRAAVTGGLKIPSRIMAGLDEWQAGRNVERLAELMTSAEGGRRLAQLATAKPGASTIALLNRIVVLGTHGGQSGASEPLKLTVRPVP